MLQTVIWTLRQRRYATIAAAMLVLALGCAVAGTWQIQRFGQSVHDNRALTRNAHATPVAFTAIPVPVAGQGSAPGRDAIRFRTVTATGTYLPDAAYLGGQLVAGNGGYYVISPLRTGTAILLVARGFVADTNGHPAPVPAPPSGRVTVTGRLDTTSSLPAGDPGTWTRRLGRPVYLAMLKLAPAQPGGAGLVAIPRPDLSNPAGGAYEAQHFAYIVQWYIFAIIALCAPFLLARNEVREAQRRYLGVDVGELELDASGEMPPLGGSAGSGSELALRPDGALARRSAEQSPEIARAQRLADRYGSALSMGADVPRPATRFRRRTASPVGGLTDRVPSSADVPHRSHDAYQGAYNDYLWQLGLADGDVGTPNPSTLNAVTTREPERSKAIEAVIVDVQPDSDAQRPDGAQPLDDAQPPDGAVGSG